jgi:N-acyl-D-aspartate/D-glutamate deacylase
MWPRHRWWAAFARQLFLCLLGAGFASGTAQADKSVARYDLVLHHGTVVDGTGAPRFVGDVAIAKGRIAGVGDLGPYVAGEEIDVTGLVVAPGFIDVHSHADEGLIDPRLKTDKGFVTQGVTTSVFGVDGEYSLDTIRTFMQTFDHQGVGTNYLFYVGHGGIRKKVMGMDDRAPTTEELQRMQDIVRDAMQQGMIGLSSGLMYLPGRYARTKELIALAQVTSQFEGLYDSHIRDPASHLMDSIRECIEIGERAGAKPHLAHLKAVGKRNFGRVKDIVQLVNLDRARGIPVTADVYPYDGASARKLVAVLVPPPGSGMTAKYERLEDSSIPRAERAALLAGLTDYWQKALRQPEVREKIRKATESPPPGEFSWVQTVGYGSFRVVVSTLPWARGRMIQDLAEARGVNAFDLIAELILAEGSQTKITLGAIDEAEVRTLLKQPWVMISSDGKLTGLAAASGHPRYRGTFPRVLGRYVREWGVLSLEQAIHKMTGLSAQYLGLAHRGRLAKGNWADITVFDPDKIIDRATWDHPERYSEGVVDVLINGIFALREGEMTGRTPGRFLPYHGRKP